MPFEIIRNDITNMCVDAIVNAANPRAIVGYGVDSGIHAGAGERLLKARQKIGDIAFGDAAITPAYDLSAKYVIHAVSPIWQGGTAGEAALLESCYRKSLELARAHRCRSVAFPLLSAGNHGFPKELALQIAIKVFSSFLLQHEMQIYLVVFGKDSFALSEKLFHAVQSYIDEHYIQEKTLEEYGVAGKREIREAELSELRRVMLHRRRAERAASLPPEEAPEACREESMPAPLVSAPAPAPRRLEDLMQQLDETFSEALIRLIDEKGLRDPDVYKKANVDRKFFSKIKNNRNYRPSKITCVAFAIALGLNLDETRDLIGKAGYALTHSSKFDVIVEYFILEGNYDLFEINQALFQFEEPLIGQ